MCFNYFSLAVFEDHRLLRYVIRYERGELFDFNLRVKKLTYQCANHAFSADYFFFLTNNFKKCSDTEDTENTIKLDRIHTWQVNTFSRADVFFTRCAAPSWWVIFVWFFFILIAAEKRLIWFGLDCKICFISINIYLEMQFLDCNHF